MSEILLNVIVLISNSVRKYCVLHNIYFCRKMVTNQKIKQCVLPTKAIMKKVTQVSLKVVLKDHRHHKQYVLKKVKLVIKYLRPMLTIFPKVMTEMKRNRNPKLVKLRTKVYLIIHTFVK